MQTHEEIFHDQSLDDVGARRRNFHRNQRSRGTFVNELEMIKGIGKNTTDNLLKKFRSVKKIKEISNEELAEVVGKAKAGIILTYFNTLEKNLNEI